MTLTALHPFQKVLDENREGILRFLVALVGPGEADDCFQETFISALRAYPRLEQGANVRAWLFTIARHKAIDAHRSRSRRALPADDLPERAAAREAAGVDGLGVAAGPGGLGVDRELWGLVRALPPKQRGAIALRFVADLSHAEVGLALGCSEDAARRNLHEALQKLRKEWDR